MDTVIVDDISALEAVRGQWQALADRATEPNPFYEPWALIPAFRHLGRGERPRVAFVWRSVDRSELVGVFPFAGRRGFHHAPVGYAGLWRHVHCFLATPLIARGVECEVWRAFLRTMARRSILFDVGGMSGDGPVRQGLDAALAEDNLRFEDGPVLRRPLFDPQVPAEQYLERVLKTKRRRQFDKKRQSLGGAGIVRYERVATPSELICWADDFLALEESGWKGRGHTALRGRANEVRYFQEIISSGGALGKVAAYRLIAPVGIAAMRFDLVTQGAAFALKIAYDERFARSSPGALLEIEILHDLLARASFRFVDSCTVPSPHSVHGYFWREERSILTRFVAAPGLAGSSIVGVALTLRRMRELLRRRRAAQPIAAI